MVYGTVGQDQAAVCASSSIDAISLLEQVQ
jgi:hypothetical protein